MCRCELAELDGDELVSDIATVQVIRQLKIETRNDPTIKGKKMDVLLNNTGEDVLTITQVEREARPPFTGQVTNRGKMAMWGPSPFSTAYRARVAVSVV